MTRILCAALALVCFLETPATASTFALESKVAELRSACGASVTTHGKFRPRAGYHGSDRARDMRGNYRCMYAHLRDWRGGVSTDPGRVGHIHFDDRGYRCQFAHGRRGCSHAVPGG